MRPTRPTALRATLLLGAFALTAAACAKYGSGDAQGDLVVITASTGTPDPDGFELHVTGRDSVAMADNDTTRFNGMPIGDYTVALTGVFAGCTVAGGASQSVYVPVGVKKFEFDVTCP